MRQIILDTETTGLEPKEGHRIIEIGCLELINRRPTGNNYHVYLNPERSVPKEAQAVHGLSESFLADKAKFKDIVDELIAYLKGAELVIHNAPFDVGFLNYEFQQVSDSYAQIDDYCQVCDTLTLARKLHPGRKNNLDALCKRYNIDNTDRSLHGALLDAKLLSQVYLAMTGGQVALFQTNNESQIHGSSTQAITKISAQRNYRIPVIKATHEEFAEHKKFMQAMKEKN